MEPGNSLEDSPVHTTGVITDVQPAVVSVPEVAPTSGSPLTYNRTALVATLAVVSLILLVGVTSVFYGLLHSANNSNQKGGPSSYSIGKLSTHDVAVSQDLLSNGAGSLTINGDLKVNNGVILAPSAAPSSPQSGQIYYDNKTNAPYYFNGKSFVSLAPTLLPQFVSSIGGAQGAITVGNSLQLAGGQLSISPAVSQSISLLTQNLNALSSSVTAQNTNAIHGSGVANSLPVFSDAGTLAASILSQSGSNLSASGGLTLTGNISAAQVQGASGQFTGTVSGADAVNGNEFTTLSQVGALVGAPGSFIANGIGTQTNANFNIQSAADGSVTAVLKARASQTADLLQVQNSAAQALAGINTTGQLVFYNPGSASPDTNLYRSAAGALKTDSSITINTNNFAIDNGTAFIYHDTAVTSVSGASVVLSLSNRDTTVNNVVPIRFNTVDGSSATRNGGFIALQTTARAASSITSDIIFGTANSTGAGASEVARLTAAGQLQILGSGSTAGLLLGGSANLYSSAANALKTDGSLTVSGDLTGNGHALFKNTTDSTTAFQIQNAAGANLFQIDNANNNILIGGNNSAELQPWQTAANSLPGVRSAATTVTANGYVYVIGGDDGTTYYNTVYYAKLNADGTTGVWQTNANALPAARDRHSSIVANGYIYVIGGSTDGTSANAQSTVYYAKLNADGTTGVWQTNANALPATIYRHASVSANGYVYVLAGRNGTPQSTVYYAKLNADGTTGVWQTNANSLPGSREILSSVVANGYVYVLGGSNGTSPQSTVYYAKLNADGTTGVWQTNANSMPNTRYRHASVVTNGYVYVIGGSDATNVAQSTVYYAKLNADGTTGVWQTNANVLPDTRNSTASIVVNGYVYSVGGSNAGGVHGTVFYTSTQRIKVGGSLDLVGLAGGSYDGVGYGSGQGSVGGELTAGNTNIIGSLQVQGSANFGMNVNVTNALSVGGQANFRNSTDSTTAFQIQNAAGASIVNVDTSLGKTTFAQSNVVLTGLTAPTGLNITAGANSGGSLKGTPGITYYYRVTAITATGETLASSTASINSSSFSAVAAPSTAPTATVSGTAGLPNGTYTYKVTFVTANGETTAGPTSNSVSPVSSQVSLSSVPTGATGVTARNIYRTAAGGIDGTQKYVGTITNNTTTTFTDNIADSALSVGLPASNNARTDLNNATVNFTTYGGATSYRIYRGTALGQETAYQTTGSSPFTDTGAVGTVGTVQSSDALSRLGIGTSSPVSSLDATGTALFKSAADNSTAFQIQNAAGLSLFQADTANSVITLGNTSGELQAWQTSSNGLPVALGQAVVLSANQYIYYIGGNDGSGTTGNVSTVYYAKLNADGSSAAWQTNANSLPQAVRAAAGVVANGYAYSIGGHDTTASGALSTVYYAKLNADGTTGVWQTNANSLPQGVSSGKAVAYNGYVYLIGGDVGTTGIGNALSTVYYAKLNADGTTGVWQTNANSLPQALSSGTGAVANGYIYFISGSTTVSFVGAQSTVYYAKLNADGTTGVWQTNANSLPQQLQAATSAVANGYIYVLGGVNNQNVVGSTVYYAKLNANGTVGAWQLGTNALPQSRQFVGNSIVANGYIYEVGGATTSGARQTTTYYSSTQRIKIGGALDLVGMAGGLNDGSGYMGGQGSVGGELTAGNTNVIGALQVQGSVLINQSLSLAGNLNSSGSALFKNSTDSTTAFQVQNAAGSTLLKSDTTNTTLTVNSNVAITGGIGLSEVAAPVISSVSNIGTAGATTDTYVVVACSANGLCSAPSGAVSTATANATLDGTNFNRISWAAVSGAATYKVYRTVAGGTPSTTGVISTVSGQATTSLDDTGLAGDGASTPSSDGGSGAIIFTGAASNATVLKSKLGSEASSRFIVQASGSLLFGGGTASQDVQLLRGSAGNLTIVGQNGATATSLVVKAVAAQTSDLFQLQNSSGANLLRVAADGTLIAADGSGTDSAGSDLFIAGGKGTGTANGGDIYFRIAPPAGVSGSTSNALISVLRVVASNGSALFKNAVNSTSGLQVQPSASTTPVLDVDTTNLRVGVNTSSPEFALHVKGSNAGGDTAAAIQNTGATNGDTASLIFRTTTGAASWARIQQTRVSATGASLGLATLQGGTLTTSLILDETGKVSAGAGATPANGVLTVGTNTAAASGGLYFGTDTNLYRSNANVLKTDGSLIATLSINSGGNLNLTSTSGTSGAITKARVAGAGGVTINDVVVLNASGQAVDTTTARDTRVYGVALATTASGSSVNVAISGDYQVTADTGAVAIGDQLVTSTTSGQVTVDNNATTGILGRALTNKAGGSSGLVTVALRPVNGQSTPIFRNTTDSTTAFQIQNSVGTTNVLTADTTNTRVGIGTATPGNLLSIGALTTAAGTYKVAVSTGGTTNSGIVIQTVAGQSAGNILQAQDSTGAALATLDYQGNLTVKAATFNGNITVNGHVITGNTSGSTSFTNGASTTCNASSVGNDTAGTITISTTSWVTGSGTLCTINFAGSYGSAPHPVISAANGNAASAGGWYTTSATGSFTVENTNGSLVDATYTFNYFNAQ